jgi:hypothetical protein
MNAIRMLRLAVIFAILSGMLTAFCALKRISPSPLYFEAAFFPLLFAWYYYDSIDRGFKRTRLMSMGVIVLAIIFLPVYLIRSRSGNQRWLAVLKFFAFMFLLGVVAVVSGLPITWLLAK